MSFFEGISTAQVSRGGVYILPGQYKLRIVKTATGKSRKGDDFFVAEFDVLESDNSERPPGTQVSWMVMKKHDSFLGNVKQFAIAATQAEEGEVTAEAMDTITSEQQPLAGQLVACQAINHKTKANTDFTKVLFAPLSE